ncbi:hypothetical protein ACE5JW_11575 [Acinetobacter radioresistens]|jgi:hypothetical protein|uniref:hypothetical protein n=1 Tax=Acinetobacter TaxID=469 RepID=UPI0002CFE2C9|nr:MULTISPECIES: hypothetical protein [Acinetobacter]ENV88180.1 hypothetical protein F940_00026 [Acinetobacter radioresistens NIPH 2130]EXB80135.1 hypothetical protein J538_3056 [Acinetobacter sp. 272263]MCK4078593.1 hypothetical protein [Acinetobacter radioresistens]MCK4084883.1 hypothetical protein [Acinetobacter radioresistens]MCK4097218.1 hypothetical protein [Acinetobacter radioresistens]
MSRRKNKPAEINKDPGKKQSGEKQAISLSKTKKQPVRSTAKFNLNHEQNLVHAWAKAERHQGKHLLNHLEFSHDSNMANVRLNLRSEPFNGLHIDLMAKGESIKSVTLPHHFALARNGYRIQTCYSAIGVMNVIKSYLNRR